MAHLSWFEVAGFWEIQSIVCNLDPLIHKITDVELQNTHRFHRSWQSWEEKLPINFTSGVLKSKKEMEADFGDIEMQPHIVALFLRNIYQNHDAPHPYHHHPNDACAASCCWTCCWGWLTLRFWQPAKRLGHFKIWICLCRNRSSYRLLRTGRSSSCF